MLRAIRHLENASQNHSGKPRYTCQDDDKNLEEGKWQVLAGMWRTRTPWPLLLGMGDGLAVVEKSWGDPQQVRRGIGIGPSNSAPLCMLQSKYLNQILSVTM